MFGFLVFVAEGEWTIDENGFVKTPPYSSPRRIALPYNKVVRMQELNDKTTVIICTDGFAFHMSGKFEDVDRWD